MARDKGKPDGHHVGSRHNNPKHKGGEWHPQRSGDEADVDATDAPKNAGGFPVGRGPGRTAQAWLAAGGLTLLATIAETVGRGLA